MSRRGGSRQGGKQRDGEPAAGRRAQSRDAGELAPQLRPQPDDRIGKRRGSGSVSALSDDGGGGEQSGKVGGSSTGRAQDEGGGLEADRQGELEGDRGKRRRERRECGWQLPRCRPWQGASAQESTGSAALPRSTPSSVASRSAASPKSTAASRSPPAKESPAEVDSSTTRAIRRLSACIGRASATYARDSSSAPTW